VIEFGNFKNAGGLLFKFRPADGASITTSYSVKETSLAVTPSFPDRRYFTKLHPEVNIAGSDTVLFRIEFTLKIWRHEGSPFCA
jgi:hypothetical protein